MIPMMAAYGLFSLLTFFLWKKLKKTVLLAHEKDVQNEKVSSVLKSMQRMTGMLAEHIAIQSLYNVKPNSMEVRPICPLFLDFL